MMPPDSKKPAGTNLAIGICRTAGQSLVTTRDDDRNWTVVRVIAALLGHPRFLPTALVTIVPQKFASHCPRETL